MKRPGVRRAHSNHVKVRLCAACQKTTRAECDAASTEADRDAAICVD